MKKTLMILCGLLLAIQSGFSAENPMVATTDGSSSSSLDSFFQKGKWEIGVNSGLMFSPSIVNVQQHTVNYTTTGIQAGLMLSTPGSSGWFRGNFEGVAELFASGLIEGRGSYVAGGTLWLRYNFMPNGWRVTPYVQLGAGGESTDIDRRILGQDFNFNVDGAAGLRFLVSARCSLNAEWRFEHFSDLDMTKVNRGVNAQGIVLGVSWLF